MVKCSIVNYHHYPRNNIKQTQVYHPLEINGIKNFFLHQNKKS